MNDISLTEQLRKIMDELLQIEEAVDTKKVDNITSQKKDKNADIDSVLVIPRDKNLKRENVKSVMELIAYLDQFASLSKWRNNNAEFDDAFYTNMPVEALAKATRITPKELKIIAKNTKKFQGHIWLNNQGISIFGKC